MFLLIEIMDGSLPKNLNEKTIVDLDKFESLEQAIIYAEPENLDENTLLVASHEGEFSIVPKSSGRELPSLIKLWSDRTLASVLFKRFDLQGSK